MKVAARVGRESLAQLLGFAVQLADRILIAALLVRVWGVQDFAAWSLILAAGGMVALFDLGVNLYFANRVLFLVQQGRRRAARVLLRAGNLMMIIASALGLAAVAIGFAFIDPADSGIQMTASLWLAAFLLALTSFFRAASSIQMSVYRAHEQYARQSLLLIAVDAARIAATVAVVLGGGSLLAAATAQCVVALIGHGFPVLLDSPKRFPGYEFGIGPMPRQERRRAALLSLGFWIQSAPNTAMTHLPVFLLSGVANAAMMAQFVLMRTLGNFVRAALQPFAITFGQESGRRLALDDVAGIASTYREATYLLGALGAVPAGLLVALGPGLFATWTGQPELYSQWLLVLAIAPALLLPSLAIAQTYLVTANDPWPIAWGRLLQFSLFLLFYVLLPIEGAGLRMMAALALSEPLGLGLLLSWRVHRTVAGTGLRFHVEMVARLAVVFAGTWAAAAGAGALGDPLLVHLALGLAGGAAAGALLTFLCGLTRERRRALIAFARDQMRSRSASSRARASSE
jgi:O-antigen/teichoic acid export membrane protein